ncbi:MAG: tetratricopeptide repeat protein [Acidobacteriota bacterium]
MKATVPHIALLLGLLLLTGTALADDSTDRDRARQLLDEGEDAAARKLVESMIEQQPQDADLWVLLATAHHHALEKASLLRKRHWAGQQKGALEQALDLDPNHIEARAELADFYYYAPGIVGGSKTKAGQQLALLERTSPYDAHWRRALHARSENDHQGAVDAFRSALAARPGDVQARFGLALHLGELASFDEAFELHEELIAEDPEGVKGPYYQIGRLAVISGQRAERGIACLEHYLEVADSQSRPPKAYGHWRLGALLLRQGDREGGLRHLNRALYLSPGLEGAQKDLREAGG